MDLFEAGDILRQHLVTTVTALPAVFPNDKFPSVSSHPIGFLYVQVLGVSGDQITLGEPGARSYRDSGLLSVHVAVPRGSGVGGAETIARAVRAAFLPENWSGLDLHILKREIGDGAESIRDDGAWWLIPVTIEFIADRKE